MSASLKDLIENIHVLWILVDPDGASRILTPVSFPFASFQSEQPLGGAKGASFPIDGAVRAVMHFIEQHPEWAVLLSTLRHDPTVRKTLDTLPGVLARELPEADYHLLMQLGMELPFGDWARMAEAVIYRLEAKPC